MEYSKTTINQNYIDKTPAPRKESNNLLLFIGGIAVGTLITAAICLTKIHEIYREKCSINGKYILMSLKYTDLAWQYDKLI